MSTQERKESGRFTFKSDTHRSVRSIRTTDNTWEVLGSISASWGITRADLLEYIVDSGKLESLFLEQKTSPELSEAYLESLSVRSLSKLKLGTSSPSYKSAKKTINWFIKDILSFLQSG
jgi:hypothetical protein